MAYFIDSYLNQKNIYSCIQGFILCAWQTFMIILGDNASLIFDTVRRLKILRIRLFGQS